MPTPYLEKAAAVAVLAKKHGGVFVFATQDASFPHKENTGAEIAKSAFAEYACGGCGAHVAHAKVQGLQPYCVLCGSEDTKQVRDVKPTIPADKELSFLTCNHCDTATVFRDDLVMASKASLHCSVCSNQLLIKSEFEEELDVPGVDDMELVDVDGTSGDEELSDTTMDTPADSVSPELKPEVVEPNGSTQDMPSDDVSDKLTPDEPSPTSTQQEESAEIEGEEVEVDFMDELDDEAVELSLVHLGQNMSIVGAGQILATLTPQNAGKNADILQTQEFANAVFHSLSSRGLKKTVAEFKFTPNRVKVGLSRSVAKRVEARVEEKTQELSALQKSVMKDVDQALQISVAGYAGNFWRDRTDPLKIALAAELRAVGVRSSQAIVDRVFASHAIEHYQQVVAMAKDLLEKPIEVRNSLASAIDLAKYQPMVTKASEGEDTETEDDEDETDEDTEVANIATPVSEVATASSNARSPYRSKELQSVLGSDSFPFL